MNANQPQPAAASSNNRLFFPRRQLGKTGFVASQLGIGDLADRSVPQQECVATARRAIDAGLNLIDTAPSYENGYSEQIVGQAVRGFGQQLFVIDKIDHHDQPVAPQVEASLGRLQLDQVDLFVFHAVSTLAGWENLAAPGGPFAQLERCREQGRCRFRGISSHHPLVLQAAILSGLCDVVMFPLGPYVDQGYIDLVLPLCKEKQVGSVCFKCFGAGKLLADTSGYNQPLVQRPRGKMSSGGQVERVTADDLPTLPRLTVAQCLHFAMTCDPDVVLLGLSFPNEQDAAFAAARSFSPLSPQQMRQIQDEARIAIADKGACWWNPPAAPGPT